MVTYKYTAVSNNGQKVSGVIEGYNQLDAIDRIKQQYSIVLKLTEVKDAEEKPGLLNMEVGKPKLNAKAFTVMCSQFAIILSSGIPISRTVHLIADKTTDKPLKRMLKKVASDVEAGRSISASFEERGADLLPTTFIETIRAGEQSGNLDKAFESTYQHFDKQVKMKGKVRAAIAYPAFVLVIAVIVVVVLMVKVVPTFTAIFDSYEAELPGITKSLIAISNFFGRYWMLMAAIVAAIVLGLKIYGNTEEGRLNLAKLKLKLPVMGNIYELTSASEFANTMATMLGAGLPLTRCISITAKVLSNYFKSQEVGKLSGRLEQGYALAQSMREAEVMPDILTDMVGVGEETGEMEKTMKTIAGYYDTELEMATASALAKLEPALLIGLAVIAGYIVFAVYIAMFSMYAAM